MNFTLRTWILGSAVLAFVAAVPLVLAAGLPPALLALAPLAGATAAVFLWNSHWALCFCAFSLMPLGGLNREVLGVTFYLPEVLLLLLFSKEALRAIARRERFVRGMPVLPLALYLGAAVLAVGTGLAHGHGLVAVLQDCRQWVEFIILFWLVLQRVSTREQLVQILYCLVMGATFGAVHAIYQYHLNRDVLLTEFSGLAASKDLRSRSFFHPNTFAGLMGLSVGAATALLWTTNRRFVKGLMLLCIILFLIAQVYTASRGAWLGTLFMFSVMALFVRPTKRLVLVAGIGMLILTVAAGPLVLKRLATLGAPQSDQSLMDRAQHYTAATYIIRDYPLFGLGWGAYFDFTEIVNKERYVKSPPPPNGMPGTVHSLYLQLYAKMGIFGLLAFLALMTTWLERVWRVLRERQWENQNYRMFATLSAGVAGTLMQNSIENYFHHQVMGQAFWLMLGMSFLTARWVSPRPASFRVPLLVLVAAAAAFLVFLYGSLALAKLDIRNEYFERSVRIAVEEVKPARALALAAAATTAEHPSAMSYALHGQLLMETGETNEGLEELNRAVQVLKKPEPPYQETRKPFYLAPSRLLLGRYWLEQEKPLAAVEQFELAGGYADLGDPAFAAFHKSLYDTYAKQGLWARALRYGTPAVPELKTLPAQDLLEIARICPGRQDWPLAALLAGELEGRKESPAVASYLLGRVKLQDQDPAEAIGPLKSAEDGGHTDAAYFLGIALNNAGQRAEAVEAFSRVPASSPYRLFGLGQAYVLLSGLSAEAKDKTQATPESLLAALDQELDSIRSHSAFTRNGTDPSVPAAILTSNTHPVSDGFLPVVVLWDQLESSPKGMPPVSVEDTEDGGIALYRGGAGILQVQWVENLVNWESITSLPENTSITPGWTDVLREWHGIDSASSVLIEKDDRGKPCLTLSRQASLYSVPVLLEEDAGYILAADAQGGGTVGWQFLDKTELVKAEGEVQFDPQNPGQGGFLHLRAEADWEVARVVLDLKPRRGRFSVSEILMFKIERPVVHKDR